MTACRTTTIHYEERLDRGIELFNQGKFFEAHEEWEAIWLCAEQKEDKRFLQGLLMAAGAFLHYRKRECTGASALLGKSRKALESGLNIHPEIRLAEFMRDLDSLRRSFDRCLFDIPAESLPKIGTYSRPFVQRQLY